MVWGTPIYIVRKCDSGMVEERKYQDKNNWPVALKMSNDVRIHL